MELKRLGQSEQGDFATLVLGKVFGEGKKREEASSGMESRITAADAAE
jgi:hypothetical protein